MMTFNKILTACLLAGIATGASAQSAEWRVVPKYTEMTPFAAGLYQVREGKKSGIIDDSGREVVPVKYDRITPFYEGLAVIYDNTAQGMVFRGVISEGGEVNMADDRFYLFPEWTFFSEGFIPVIEPGGKYGYLNTLAQPAFRFTSDMVHPFSEGMAVVGDGDGFRMLTSGGEELLIQLPDGDYAFGGTNYCNGKTLVWDGDWCCYILDDSGDKRRWEKIGKQDIDSDVRVDYLYRFGSGKGTRPVYGEYMPVYEREWRPSKKDGRWTFTNASGKPLTPYRYDSVENFAGGVAIASDGGKYGLLEVVEDTGTFNSTVKTARHTYSPGKSVNCSFTLSVPPKWQGQDYVVEVRDTETGEMMGYVKKGDQYSFDVTPAGSRAKEEKHYAISVNHNGINLWKGEADYEFNQRTKLTAAIRLSNADANSSDQCIVIATVKNPSSVPVTTTVTLSGGGNKATFAGKTVTVTIPPYGTKSVSSAFTVRKVELNGWCAVSTGDGASARRSGLQLKPF